MSHNPDPCYCGQASDYEDLLERVLQSRRTYGVIILEDFLIHEIRKTLKEYKEAQEEYADDDE
jgi:vacuolar-type H+-ATPase subunit F/Vma7